MAFIFIFMLSYEEISFFLWIGKFEEKTTALEKMADPQQCLFQKMFRKGHFNRSRSGSDQKTKAGYARYT
jgi:hypothetical protein